MSIAFKVEKSIGFLKINRPEKLNALDIKHLESIYEHMKIISKQDHIKVLIISGTKKSFSVGSDIKELNKIDSSLFTHATNLYQRIAKIFYEIKIPTISFLRGHVIGGGFELALMTHIRVADKSVEFSLPDIQWGFSPSGGLTYFLPRLVGQAWAQHILLTGNKIKAEKALDIGLVTQLENTEHAWEKTLKIAEDLSHAPKVGILNTLELLRMNKSSFEEVLSHEAELDKKSFACEETKNNLLTFRK